MAADELSAALKDISIDEYMLKSRFTVKAKDDCFFKMADWFTQESSVANQCVIGSRYASTKGQILDKHAHPVVNPKFSLFHNGFISNFKELAHEDQMTDSEVIAHLIDI